jgi:para-nitrobenzyl esterase
MAGRDPSLLKLDWSQVPGKLAAAFRKSEAELAPAIEAYRKVYPNGDATDIFFRMETNQRFGRAAFMLANLKAAQPAPVFFYRFQYDPGLNGLRTFHTSDLPLTLRMVLQPAAEPLSKRLGGAFANFVRHGDPNGPGLPAWPRYEPTQQPMMLFDRDVIPAGPDPEGSARKLLYSIIGEQPGS